MSSSLEPAFLIFRTFLANSITASCIPKHIPKNGIFICLANLIDIIFPSVPRLPKPPGISIPDTFFKFLFISLLFNFSESKRNKFTLTLFLIPP